MCSLLVGSRTSWAVNVPLVVLRFYRHVCVALPSSGKGHEYCMLSELPSVLTLSCTFYQAFLQVCGCD